MRSQQLPTLTPNAATRRINTGFPRAELTLPPMGLAQVHVGLITNCADCMDRDPLARLWRAAGARDPETGY